MSDLIDRQQAINAVGFYSCHFGGILQFADKALKQLPSAQPEPCTDAISRAEAINALSCLNPTEWFIDYDDAIEAIKELPSAEPERKTGRWIECYPEGFWKCSKCNFVSEASAADVLYHFCPNCGCKMEENRDS